MSLPLALAVYFIFWWLCLFIILPLGVRTQEEEGDVVPGSVPSAPARPKILMKMGLTTILSALLFALFYVLIVYEILTLESFSFLPII